LVFSREDVAEFAAVCGSRTEPASRGRAGADACSPIARRRPFTRGFEPLGDASNVEDAAAAEKLGIMEGSRDSPRPGRERAITERCANFCVDLLGRKPKDLWVCARVVDDAAADATHSRTWAGGGTRMPRQSCSGHVVQNSRPRMKSSRTRCALSGTPRPLFDDKMAEVLCVYREVRVVEASSTARAREIPAVAIISYDEKPGVQAIGTTARTCRRSPLRHNCVAARSRMMFDTERMSLLPHRSCDRRGPCQRGGKTSFRASSSPSCKSSTPPNPPSTAIKIDPDNHSAHVSIGNQGLARHAARAAFYFRVHAQAWLMAAISLKASSRSLHDRRFAISGSRTGTERIDSRPQSTTSTAIPSSTNWTYKLRRGGII